MAHDARKRRVLRQYVGAVACLAALGFGGVFVASDGRPSGSLAAFVVVVALGAVHFWFPLLKTGAAGARTSHLVELPLAAALLLLDPRRALVAYVLGLSLAWLGSRRSPIKTVFGIAEHSLAGALAVLVIESVGRAGLPGGTVPYVPAALVVYFAVNMVLNNMVFELAGLRRPGEPFFIDLVPSMAVSAVGGLGGAYVGLVGRMGPGAVLLATVPVGLLFVLSRSHGNRGRTIDVLQGIVHAVADHHAGMSTEQVEQAVCARVMEVLQCPAAQIRDTEPDAEAGEIGSPVGRRWLVVQARPVEPFRPEEAELLRALAGVAARALENASLQEQLQRMALHDPLTGAPNRRLLTSELDKALARARRHGGQVGVAFLDLTEFKAVNDQFGHEAGDELLRLVANRVAGCVRAGDIVGRFGGDEFVVLFPTCDARTRASVIGRVIDAFTSPFVLSTSGPVMVHANIGVSVWPGDGATADDLLRRADAAMYEAKLLGGNTLAFARAVLAQ
jgi:diguanylate cyclase (GGDEF)-like protein